MFRVTGLSDCFGQFFENYRSSPLLCYFFPRKKLGQNLTTRGFGYNLGDFLQAHLVTLIVFPDLLSARKNTAVNRTGSNAIVQQMIFFASAGIHQNGGRRGQVVSS
jgi:hypothetical protein